MKYLVIAEQGPTSWGAHVPDLPGCVAAGESRDEVLALIRDAVALHLEALQDDGASPPVPHTSAEVVEFPA